MGCRLAFESHPVSTVERLRELVQNPPRGEDGEVSPVKLLPPVSPGKLAELEAEIGAALSPECRQLLSGCAGWEEGPLEGADFIGATLDFDPSPCVSGARMQEIATDGLANSWFYWKSARSPDLGPVFFYQHEVPMIVRQSDRLVDFVNECVRMITPPYQSLIDDLHEFRLKPVKDLNNDLVARESALASGDAELARFARDQTQAGWFCDLRKTKVGEGVNLAALDVVGLHPRLPLLALQQGRSGLARFFLGRRKVPAL
jgi:hypothetical protein